MLGVVIIKTTTNKKGLLFSKKEQQIKTAFKKIKEEMTEHLESINENTNEIQSSSEYLCEIDDKIEKLTERIEEISIFIGMNKSYYELTNPVQSLTINEKEVFMVFYTLGEEKGYITYEDIAKKLGLTEQLAMSYTTSIASKGVPIMKRYIDNKAHFRLNPDFKRLQAKENFLNIDKSATQKLLINF